MTPGVPLVQLRALHLGELFLHCTPAASGPPSRTSQMVSGTQALLSAAVEEASTNATVAIATLLLAAMAANVAQLTA